MIPLPIKYPIKYPLYTKQQEKSVFLIFMIIIQHTLYKNELNLKKE